MYSEHGLEALIRAVLGQVCQSLIVVSNWMPGSAQAQAASAIWSHRSRALTFFIAVPSVRAVSSQSPSSRTASTNSFETRTELFEFWPETVA